MSLRRRRPAARGGGSARIADSAGSRGVSLIELMVAVTVLSVVTLSTALAYSKVMQALVLTKARGISSRLAQDKFETLRGLSYELLMVTPQADLDIPPGVDLTNYPPESFAMGGKVYTRQVIVSRVYRDSAGNLVVLSPNAADTGLKQIRILVQFPQGGTTETRSYTSLVTDPGLIPLDSTLYGVVRDTAGAPIPNAGVFVNQNQNWWAQTTSTGYYQIQMDTRSYTVTATKAGYWDVVSATITPYGSTQLNFTLLARGRGRVTGTLHARPPTLLISGIFCGDSGGIGANSHYIELYNPTTYPVLITDGLIPKISVKRINSANVVQDVSLAWGDTLAHTIPAEGYYLIATDSPTVNGVIPDARLSSPSNPFNDTSHQGAALQDSYGIGWDTVGWTNDASSGPPSGVETAGVYVGGSNLGSGGWLGRKSNPAGLDLGVGNSYDSGNNSNDILVFSAVGAGFPRNSATPAAPVQYGIPAVSATVVATDGLSAGALASSTGYYLLADVSTGAWSVAAYFTNFSSVTPADVEVSTGYTTVLNLLLESGAGSQGGISGRVVRSDTLAPVQGIVVSAGASNTLTDANGAYVLSLTSGVYTLYANLGYGNISYNAISTTATAPSGSLVSAVDFNLVPSGVATGKVTTNGVDPYPSVPVHAVSLGIEKAVGVTDSLGNFVLYGIPVGTASIEPILDGQSQAATPGSRSVTISEGATSAGNDFTVATSLGRISGTVTASGQAITTGVLVFASTTAYASPPVVDAAYRAGGSVVYSTISDSAGAYVLDVVKNSTYTVYGYFTQLDGSQAVATLAASVPGVFVAGPTTVNLQW